MPTFVSSVILRMKKAFISFIFIPIIAFHDQRYLTGLIIIGSYNSLFIHYTLFELYFKFMLFIGQEISDRFAANNFWGTMTKRLTVRPFMNIKRPGIRKKISN